MNLHSELEVVNKDLALGLSSYYRMKELGWHDTPFPPLPISLSTKHILKHCSLCCFCFVSESQPFTSSAGFRTIIFAVLTLQATCYFSLLRYSRTRPNKMYFASTAVFLAEVIKLLVTLVVMFFQHGNLKDFGSFLFNGFVRNPLDTLKLSVPSVLYVFQNNLVYIAMTHLESTTFQVRAYYLNWFVNGSIAGGRAGNFAFMLWFKFELVSKLPN